MAVDSHMALEGLKALLKTGNMNALHTGEEAIDPRFQAHYDQYIRPHIDRFEADRVHSLATLRSRAWKVIPIAAIAIVIALVDTTPKNELSVLKALGAISMMLAIAGAVWTAMPVLHHKRSIRKTIFGEVFRFFGPSWHYTPDGIISGRDTERDPVIRHLQQPYAVSATMERLKVFNAIANGTPMPMGVANHYQGFGIVPKTEHASTRDLLVGNYKDVPITLVQCTLSNDDGKHRKGHR